MVAPKINLSVVMNYGAVGRATIYLPVGGSIAVLDRSVSRGREGCLLRVGGNDYNVEESREAVEKKIDEALVRV